MYRVSGLDKLDAIEILASTTKIQALANSKNFCFSSPGKQAQEAVLPGEALLGQGEQLTHDELLVWRLHYSE